MIPRFSLYREFEGWKDDIEEDPQGRWVKWADVHDYIVYAERYGYIPPPIEAEPPPHFRIVMVDEDHLPEDTELFDEIHTIDDTTDLYDLMTRPTREHDED